MTLNSCAQARVHFLCVEEFVGHRLLAGAALFVLLLAFIEASLKYLRVRHGYLFEAFLREDFLLFFFPSLAFACAAVSTISPFFSWYGPVFLILPPL